MKKLLAMGMFFSIFALMSGTAFAIGFCKDIAPTDPPNKTFDDEWTMNVGEEVEIDIYLNDMPQNLLNVSFLLGFGSSIEIVEVQVYDGVNGPPGPWASGCTSIDLDYQESNHCLVAVCNINGAFLDLDGDIIISRVTMRRLDEAEIIIQVSTGGSSAVVGFESPIVYDSQISPNTVTIPQIIVDPDVDADGILDHIDNCPLIPNGPDLGICTSGDTGASCTSNEDCLTDTIQDGTCCLNQEEDVCSCVSNLDCDLDVDGTDAAIFKAYFGSGPYHNPCNILVHYEYPCEGDFDCDADVDGSDAATFRQDFGRSTFCSADYSVSCMGACLSCVDGIYAYTCIYD